MDSVSHLLSLARVEARLETRCLLAPATRMEHRVDGLHVAPFHVLLEGECHLHVGARTVHMRAGDVVIIPSGAVHFITTRGTGAERGIVETAGASHSTTRSESDDDAVIDLFCGSYTFGPGAGAMLFHSLPDPVHAPFGRSPDTDEMIRALGALMRSEAEREGAGTAAIMSSLCSVLLTMVLRTSAGTDGTVLWTAAGDARIAALVDQVIADPSAEWSIDRMSRMVRMSRATFIRRFSQSTGTTVGAFLARTRLMLAADMLRTSDQNVAAVAGAVGYQSESAFSRVFKDATGMTPAKFRRRTQELD